jgi:hypothetical protein
MPIITIEQLDSLKKAIQRNPTKVKEYVKEFFQDTITVYARAVINNPWRIGMSEGGVPQGSGNLRDKHRATYGDWLATYGVNESEVPYAKYIAEGTGIYVGHKRYLANMEGIGWRWTDGMPARPWLDKAVENNEEKVNKLEDVLLEKIVNDLSI